MDLSLAVMRTSGRTFGHGGEMATRGYPAGEHKFNPEFAKRAFDARMQLARQWGRPVRLKDIAEGVGRLLGEEPPYFSTVGKWMQGQEPSMSRQLWALARFLQVDPADLLFGGSPNNRPMPPIPRGRTGKKPRRLERASGEHEEPGEDGEGPRKRRRRPKKP